MAEPSNDVERRVAAGAGRSGPPRWTTSSWYLGLLALVVGSNAEVAARLWEAGDRFGSLLAAAAAGSLGTIAVATVRRRRALRVLRADDPDSGSRPSR